MKEQAPSDRCQGAGDGLKGQATDDPKMVRAPSKNVGAEPATSGAKCKCDAKPPGPDAIPQPGLSPIAEGNTNKATGGTLHVSVKTVEKHRQQLMNRLAIHDIAGLTRYAIAKGIIESRPDMNPDPVNPS